MDECVMCGKQGENLPFTIFYDDSLQAWDYGAHICQECVQRVTQEEIDEAEEESKRFHAWADSQH